MSNNKVAVISLGTEEYEKGRLRLAQTLSVMDNYAGDFFLFENESECNSPIHRQNPYAFKIYAIEKVRDMGYNQILWLDCSVYAIKSIVPIFDKISEDGYICQKAGHYVGTWTNDRTLIYFGLSRDEAMDIMMYGNAGFLGLDFNTEIANEFLNRWKQSMLDGMFIGDWDNNRHQESPDSRCRGHRHDMSCGSIIRHQLGMKLQSDMDYLQYVHHGSKMPYNDTVSLFAQGIR